METTTAKKPGRPPKGAVAMTTAQRVRETRQRAERAMMQAYEDGVQNATTKAILGNLARQIKMIETNPDQKQTAQAIAGELMGELCNRYRIVIG